MACDDADRQAKEFAMKCWELATVTLAVIGLVSKGEDALAQTAWRNPIDVKANVLNRLFPLAGC